MKFIYCFAAGVVFPQYLIVYTFSEKKHSAAIYFPPLVQRKTNTSAAEFLTEMIIPSPCSSLYFFSQPYAVLNVPTCMEKVYSE